MANEAIEPGTSVIDSRDVIERIDYLQTLLQEEIDKLNAINRRDAEERGALFAEIETDLDDAREVADLQRLRVFSETNEEVEELANLLSLRDQSDDCGDWVYGATLIHTEYFVDYTEELIKDCYDLPKEMKSGQWPWRHITIDYEAAARELEQDYTLVTFGSEDYFIRN